MTNQQHPITPPPELVEQWRTHPEFVEPGLTSMVSMTESRLHDIATQAARWGADQELEACIDVVLSYPGFESPELFVEVLREARRPKPPSLKEQALALLDKAEDPSWEITDFSVVRRALEQLDD